MKTTFVKLPTDSDWRRVKNHCRTTVNKAYTEGTPSEGFKRKMLLCEHSPIRLLTFDWRWERIPYWVSTEWSRHKFEKFISTQRDDRTYEAVPRGRRPQDAPVDYDGYANMQNLIDAWRKRMCYQATKEARELAEDFRLTLEETHPLEANVLVPNCIYRGGCPEMKTCGLYEHFLRWCKETAPTKDVQDLQNRYDLYTTYLHLRKGMKR